MRTPRTFRLLLLAGATLALLASACGDDDASPSTTDPDAPDRLTVLSLGATSDGEPTIVLTPLPTVGDTYELMVTLDQQQWVVGPGAPPRVRAPVSIMELAVEITAVESTGGYTSRQEVTGFRAGDPGDSSASDIETFDAAVDAVIGLVAEVQVDRYGVVTDRAVELPDGLDPSVQALGESMIEFAERASTTVPAQTLGVGASWTDTVEADVEGVNTTIVSSYDLVEIRGDQYTLELSYEQETRGMVADSDRETSVEGLTNGTGSIRANVAMPGALRSTLEAQGVLDLTSKGPKTTVEIELGVELRGS